MIIANALEESNRTEATLIAAANAIVAVVWPDGIDK